MSESLMATQDPGRAKARIWPMYRTVVGVGISCALVIVIVFELTRPIIERNKVEMRKQAIFHVLPAAKRMATFQRTDDGSFELAAAETKQNDLVFAGFDDSDQLVGLAIEAQAMGYADVIRIIYGYSFEQQAVIGIRVLESRETPGLGDRIETDEHFLQNFQRLDVRLNENGDGLAHPIEFAKQGEKTADWQIDGISGATISSRATAKMLSESTAEWIPSVQARKTDFINVVDGQQDGR
jgi:electron transport complex protein RnfG